MPKSGDLVDAMGNKTENLKETVTIDENPIQIFVPYNGKIADINEDDTDKHILNLQTALSETRTIVNVWLGLSRQSGSDVMEWYNSSGTGQPIVNNDIYAILTTFLNVTDGATVQYKQKNANDDWDIYCLGYTVEV